MGINPDHVSRPAEAIVLLTRRVDSPGVDQNDSRSFAGSSTADRLISNRSIVRSAAQVRAIRRPGELPKSGLPWGEKPLPLGLRAP